MKESSISIRYFGRGHVGGTKFYEMFLFSGPDGGSLLVRRYGKMSQKENGGQEKIEECSGSTGDREFRKIANEKSNKGYSNPLDLEAGPRMFIRADKSVDLESLKDTERFEAAVAEVFDDSLIARIYDATRTMKMEPVIIESRAPEPTPEERGDCWGAW